MTPRTKAESRVKIFNYSDYRLFLKDWVEDRKKTDPDFSYRGFAKTMGKKAPFFLQYIIDGERSLHKESINDMNLALELSSAEAAYFTALVLYCQATTIEEKIDQYGRMMKLRQHAGIMTERDAEFEYYRDWSNVVIRNLIHICNFKDDHNMLARSLEPRRKPYYARKAVKILEKHGFIKKDKEGIYRVNEPFREADNVPPEFKARFHIEMLDFAKTAMERFTEKERYLASSTFTASEETIQEIQAELDEFRDRIKQKVAKEKKSNRVYHINFNLFPVSRKIK